jgi:hypothetical protein
MSLYLDSANVNEAKTSFEKGLVIGVKTNTILMASEPKSPAVITVSSQGFQLELCFTS